MRFKNIAGAVLCFLTLFNFSRCVPDYRPGTGREIILLESIQENIRRDVRKAVKELKVE